jgi:hypothetical protein
MYLGDPHTLKSIVRLSEFSGIGHLSKNKNINCRILVIQIEFTTFLFLFLHIL